MEPDEARYAEIIGKRAERYLPRFRRFARGEVFSWNWAAFFGTLAWLRYRRLYLWSWLYLPVSTPLLIVWALVPATGDACQWALNPAAQAIEYTVEALVAASWIVPPLFADRLYFNAVRRLVAGEKRPAPSGRAAIIGALALQAFIVVAAAILLPSYADYTSRARVSEAVGLASGARTGLTEYAMEHGKLPDRLADINAPTSGTYVSKVELVDRITLRATFGERAGRLAGHTIALVPTWKDNQIVAWTCRSNDLPNACVPQSCRTP